MGGGQQDANAPPVKVNKLAQQLADYPKLSDKISELGELGDIFLEDFEELTSKELKDLDENVTLVNIWESLYYKGASQPTRRLVAYKINIENIRPGTNGKYAIIGRSMETVKETANLLKSFGVKVEILDDEWLSGKLYYIEGYQFQASDNSHIMIESNFWSVKKAWNDMKYNKDYKKIKDSQGYINSESDIKNLPMYKLNKLWIEDIKSFGYEIIDTRYKLKILNESPFYNMEKDILNFK